MIDSRELTKLNKELNKIGKGLLETAVKIPNEITRELAIGAVNIRNTILTSMAREKKTGKFYRKKGGVIHQASAPGEAPATDSGDMIKSIMFDVREMEVELGSIITKPPYPRWLEEGTEKMKPRPWLDPAVEKHKQAIIDRVGGGVFEMISRPFEKIT